MRRSICRGVVCNNLCLFGRGSGNSARVRARRTNTRFRICLGSTNSCGGTGTARHTCLIAGGLNCTRASLLPCNVCAMGRIGNSRKFSLVGPFSIFVDRGKTCRRFVVGGTPFADCIGVRGASTRSNLTVPCTNTTFRLCGPSKAGVSVRFACPRRAMVSAFCAGRSNCLVAPRALKCNGSCCLIRIGTPCKCILGSSPICFSIATSGTASRNNLAVIGMGHSGVPRGNIVRVAGANRIFRSIMIGSRVRGPICRIGGLTNTIFRVHTTRSVCALSNIVRCTGNRLISAVAAKSSKVTADGRLCLNGCSV